MACRQLTVNEFENLPQGTKGFDTQARCGCDTLDIEYSPSNQDPIGVVSVDQPQPPCQWYQQFPDYTEKYKTVYASGASTDSGN